MVRPWFRAVVLSLACATTQACGGSDDRFAGPPQVGEPMRAFAFPQLIDGDTVSLASLEGTPFVLNLWATWCAPCREETPYLQSIYERFRGEGLEMVGITVDGRSAMDDAQEFLDEAGATYLQLHDPAMRSLDIFRVIGLPATYVVDAGGRVRFAGNRPVREGDEVFENAVAEVVGGSP